MQRFQSYPQYTVLRNALPRAEDTLIITLLDRLSCNKTDLKAELKYYPQQNIRVKVLDLSMPLIDFAGGRSWVLGMVNHIQIEEFPALQNRNALPSANAKLKESPQPKQKAKSAGDLKL